LSRERRNVSQRKIRRISKKPEDTVTKPEPEKSGFMGKSLSPNTRMYYTKVIFGATSGLFTGILFIIIPDTIDMWFLFALAALMICIAFVRGVLKITAEEIDQRRLFLSGTFTFVLLFIVLSSLVWMILWPQF
jgi:hypothetical protein